MESAFFVATNSGSIGTPDVEFESREPFGKSSPVEDFFHHCSSKTLATELWQDKNISYFIGPGVGGLRGQDVHIFTVRLGDKEYRGGTDQALRGVMNHEDEVAFFGVVGFPEFGGKIGP